MTEQNETKLEKIYRILIVDDETEVLNALRRTLLYAEQFKSEIIGVNSANNALTELEKSDFDLILADYRMPGMTGTEFLKIVRDKYPDTIRIIVTGYSDVQIIKDAINNAEIHYYIEKPWDNENVKSVVDEALKRKVQREEDSKKQSKEDIMGWLMEVYEDVKSMGMDLSFIEQNIQVAKDALDGNDMDMALTYINHSVNIITKFAEMSYPKLSVNKVQNVQLPVKKWSKLNLEIHNVGNCNAKDVSLKLSGEFEFKEIEVVPSIGVNESRVVIVELCPQKPGTKPMGIKLYWKKPLDNSDYNFEDIFWVQVGEHVGKTKLKRTFGYHNGYIKMELNIINEDLWDIHDVELELHYDESKLRLSHIRPNFNMVNKKFIIDHIASHRGKYMEIYFDPISCTDSVISGKVSYKDLKTKDKYMTLSPQKIKILCPELFTNDRIGLLDLSKLLNSELEFKGSKVFSIPIGLDIESSHKIVKELISKYHLKIVEELNGKNPQKIETWFYGTTKDLKNKFALKLRLDGDTNCVEIYIASSNNPAITGLLTDIIFNLNHELQDRGITQNPVREIDNYVLKQKILHGKPNLMNDELRRLVKNLDVDLAQQIKDRAQPMAEKLERFSRRELVNMTKSSRHG
jgi:FixJ family two-component response regulator